MKKSLFAICMGSLMLILTAFETKAQLSVNINIGTQPSWGPAGYQRADYYYLPDIESYYNVPAHQFMYLHNGRWVTTTVLPPQYSGYDLYSGYKVVVNRPRPYLDFDQDRVRYGKYKGWKERQYVIGDRRDSRGMPPGQAKKYYRENEGDNNDHGNKHGEKHGDGEGHDHGNDHGNGKGRGNGHDD